MNKMPRHSTAALVDLCCLRLLLFNSIERETRGIEKRPNPQFFMAGDATERPVTTADK